MTMSDASKNPETRIALFQRKEVRRTIHNNEWWFVITDVITVLTDSVDAGDYLKKLRKRDEFLGEVFKGGGQFVPPLGLEFDTAGGRQLLQCWNTEGLFRLIQSIPSPKAEPFKRWLAKVGYERIQEIEDPKLATKRTRALYKAKGYSEEWIEKRMRSIAIRDELTDEWKKRGVREQREYAILTAEISKATFFRLALMIDRRELLHVQTQLIRGMNNTRFIPQKNANSSEFPKAIIIGAA